MPAVILAQDGRDNADGGCICFQGNKNA